MDIPVTDGQKSESENPEERKVPEADVEYGDDIYESASHATVDPTDYMPELKSKRKWPKVVGWTLLGLVLAAGIGAGGYWVVKHKMNRKPAQTVLQQAPASANSSSKAAAAGSNPASTANNSPSNSTKPYNSSNFNLSFNYPDGWTVSDTGNGKLTVTSPTMQLTAADGSSQTGEVIMSIQKQAAADLSMFKQGSAVAVLASQKVMYANPTSTQRAQTYLSFLQYAATTTKGGLDGVYVTGDLGYAYAQQVPESDITKIDPLIRVMFGGCTVSGKTCSSTSPLTISSQMWSNSDFSGPIESMLESLQIQ